MSVLKLSTIWNMTKVCQTQSLKLDRLTIIFINQIRDYAIHKLSTDASFSPIEKILVARAHRVGGWLNDAVTSLATCDPMPTLEDLASTLGWETVARIFWIRDKLPPKSETALRLRFTRDTLEMQSNARIARRHRV